VAAAAGARVINGDFRRLDVVPMTVVDGVVA
jgi:hypothetical protein